LNFNPKQESPANAKRNARQQRT